jgi:hypothetical protein
MNVIFVGGPDGKKFTNNYFQGLAGHGVVVTRHWPDPSRKHYVPAGVGAVIINGDASSPSQRSHVKAMCERDKVPMVVGTNSVTETVQRMAKLGLIASAKETVVADRQHDLLPELLDDHVAAPAQYHADIKDPDAGLDDVNSDNKKVGEAVSRLEEPIEMIIESNGQVRLRVTICADGHKNTITRSQTPVVWGDEFFTSKTNLGLRHNVPPGNLHSYIRSGNTFNGKVIRDATVEDVVRAFPGIKVADHRVVTHGVFELRDGRVFMRVSAGQSLKMTWCPDGVIRTRSEAAVAGKVTARVIDRLNGLGLEGYREPRLEELRAQWPRATFSGWPEPKTAPVRQETKLPVTADDVRLSDIVKTGPGINFLALVLGSGEAVLMPVSDLARRSLFTESRVFSGRDEITSLFPSGVQWVRL